VQTIPLPTLSTPTAAMIKKTAPVPNAQAPTYQKNATPSLTRTNTPTDLPPARWQPKPGTTWQYQLSGEYVDDSFKVDVYDIDLFDASADIVASLHLKNRKVVCYFSAGTWEDWREDAKLFPPSVIGRKVAGWPGESWLDIRALNSLAPVLRARLDLCRAKGFDGVDADNVDGYQNASGFPLTAADQLNFNRWLAAEAHARGLAIGLKNDPDQASDLAPAFDWALTEDCFDQGWCEKEAPFVRAAKLVVDVEYTDGKTAPAVFCPAAKKTGIVAIYKNRSLDAWLRLCP
jgi:hypothetical protein